MGNLPAVSSRLNASFAWGSSVATGASVWVSVSSTMSASPNTYPMP